MAAKGALSVAERSYPMSEVRGRSQEDPMPKRRQPRGVTPRLRSGAAAESARLRWRRNRQEELPHIQGRRGGREKIPSSEVRGGDERSYPESEVRGGGREEIPMPLSRRPGPQAGGATPPS